LLVVTDAAPYANYPPGIIGKTVFDCVVEIDTTRVFFTCTTARRTSTAGREKRSTSNSATAFPCRRSAFHRRRRNCARQDVGRHGCGSASPLPFSSQALHERQKVIEGSMKLLSKASRASFAVRRDASLTFAWGSTLWKVSSRPFRTGVMGKSGRTRTKRMIGNDVLRRFFVAFDYSRQRIHLEPGRHFEDPFDWDMAGPSHGKHTQRHARSARRHRPARRQTRTISGRETRSWRRRPAGQGLTDSEIWNVFHSDGARLKVTIDRGGESLEKILVLRRMI